MGEAQFLDVGNQPFGQLRPTVVAGHLAHVVDLALPGTGVQLVDRQRRIDPLAFATGQHPLLVLPVDGQRRRDLRRGVGRQLGRQGYRVGLERQDAVGPEDLVLVGFTSVQSRDEQLPDPRRMTQAHGMPTAIPDIEVTHHRDPPGIGRPHRETHAGDAVHRGQLGSQATAEVAVIAFGEQVQVHFAKQRPEAVGVFADLFATGPLHTQEVGPGLGKMPGEQPRHLVGFQVAEQLLLLAVQHLDTQRPGQESPDDLPTGTVAMGPEDGERVVVLGPDQGLDSPGRWQQPLLAPLLLPVREIHDCSPSMSEKSGSSRNRPARPRSGTCNQAGRFCAS